jgi:acetyl esterase
MAPNLLAYPRALSLFLRLKLLNLTSRFPPLPGGVLDEQISLLDRAQKLFGQGSLDQATPAQARLNFKNSLRMVRNAGGLFAQVASVHDLSISSDSKGAGSAAWIPARLYHPGDDGCYPLFVLFHGGGFVIGDLDTADNMARFICCRAGCTVLSVDYRLAPEHPFPAAVEDCFTATAWAVKHAAELGGDPARVLVGGDSAGGTLAAVVCQLARRSGPRLAGQALFYPSADSSDLNTPSFREFGEKALLLSKRDVDWFMLQYVPDPQQRLDPRCSPLLAADFHGLPPALVVTAEFDVLRDEGEAYARCMDAAGVPVTLMRCNGMPHGFLSLAGFIRRAALYFDEIADWIRRTAAGQVPVAPELAGEAQQAEKIPS